MTNYNPIIIPSKHIYGKPTINTLNNVINGIETTYETFKINDNNASFSFSINFSYNIENYFRDLDEEALQQNYSNLQNKTISWEEEGIFAFQYISFNTDVILDNDFMLNGLIVKTSNDRDVNSETQHTYVKEIYNAQNNNANIIFPNTSISDTKENADPFSLFPEDLKFYIIDNENDFESLEYKYWGKCALIRKNKTEFKMLCKFLIGIGYEPEKYRMQYVCYSRSIDFYPNNLTTAVETIGSGNDFSISSNEFLNNINTITANGEKIEIQKYIANNIIENYKNGKKRISIQVGYGDYYYKDGTAYGGIENKKQILKEGDIVQPMKWNGNKDIPLILKRDGSSAIFEITSAELNTQGAPKLFLELLEKTT